MRRTANGFSVAILAHNYARIVLSSQHATQSRWFSQGPSSTAPLEVPSSKADDADAATSGPPMPPNYVPVELRDASDESLMFLRNKPSAAMPKRPILPEGCIEAPHLPDRPKKEPRYIDEHAARLKTTSVGAGRPLVQPSATSFTYEDTRKQGEPNVVEGQAPQTFHRTSTPSQEAKLESAGRSGGSTSSRTAATASGEGKADAQTPDEELGRKMAAAIPRTRLDDLRADIQKLDYYQGTPEYMKELDAFRAKYGDGQQLSIEDGDEANRRPYTAEEVARGLKGEPLDLNRSSHRLQSILTQGPHGYHPDRLMQQYGFASMDAGYAFSPAKIIGQLDAAAPSGSLDANKPDYNLASQELKDQIAFNAHEDKTLAFRYLGINTIQRRQIRMCLSDLETRDYNSTLLQYYCMGMWLTNKSKMNHCEPKHNIRDVFFIARMLKMLLMEPELDSVHRKLEKPLLVVATLVMLFFLWQPVTLASIA
ncbi:Hypothetical protein, putative [Bodo saltans]|uniref:Uncharacterized protein n=1 Tax=Bodo saltans TaxID=75058 RepID=A0A0S4JJG2_BODSA|nr:Hypothetical protein, putative [Bodo saltans]|eukprot:CUG90324.1 Hypothetical protein, putative [Bodo saltans]